jgi:hypothetical protein
MVVWILATAIAGAPALAQTSLQLLPPQLEKDLAAKATNVSEVTLDKNMLGFAAKFMNGSDKDEAGVRQLIESLDGIYVRDYEFDKEGEYSMEDVERQCLAFVAPGWSPIVHDRERKNGEISDVMVKLVNGEPHGMFILSAEPKDLSIVLIMGPIRMDQLGMLKGIGGLGALGNAEKDKPSKHKGDQKPTDGGQP